MVKKVTRRMRCDVQGCHKAADFGLGLRGNDYPLCKEHLRLLVEEAMPILRIKAEKPAEKPKKLTKAELTQQAEEEIVIEESVKEETKHEEGEYFECKYCHERFSKEEYSAAKFATHVRACKKEHSVEE